MILEMNREMEKWNSNTGYYDTSCKTGQYVLCKVAQALARGVGGKQVE